MRNQRHAQGFTIIEAMIALGLVAILVSLAFPSYRAYVVRSNRTEAMEGLMASASCQERIYIINNAYDGNACESTTSNGMYVITVTASNGDQNFVASAAPQGTQTEDTCGTMTLDHTGAKTAAAQAGAFAQSCWSGRKPSGS
jgi:type IV pilus assembly protein PilE